MGRKRKELNEADFYNYWLQKYHNTTIEEITEKEPELCKTVAWYKKYAVTQSEHDDWYNWAIDTIVKHNRCSRKYAMKAFAFNYLNLSPSVKEDEHTD